jgi:hypothetical protein
MLEAILVLVHGLGQVARGALSRRAISADVKGLRPQATMRRRRHLRDQLNANTFRLSHCCLAAVGGIPKSLVNGRLRRLHRLFHERLLSRDVLQQMGTAVIEFLPFQEGKKRGRQETRNA